MSLSSLYQRNKQQLLIHLCQQLIVRKLVNPFGAKRIITVLFFIQLFSLKTPTSFFIVGGFL